MAVMIKAVKLSFIASNKAITSLYKILKMITQYLDMLQKCIQHFLAFCFSRVSLNPAQLLGN